MNDDNIDMSVTLGKMKLKNPVMPSSGTFGYGQEYADFLDINDLGAVVVKCTTLTPLLGNYPRPSTEISGCCTMGGGIGRQNVGVDRFINEKLPYLRQFNTPVIVNMAGSTIEEYVRLAEILSKAEGVQALELSMRCPALKEGQADFTNPEMAFRLVKAVKGATDLTVIPKLNASITDFVPLAKACEAGGADAVCPSYDVSILGMAIDIKTRRSKLGSKLEGGLGGPWKKPSSVRTVFHVAQAVKIPVVGVGGITCAEDALEYFIVGATAVEIGSRNLIDPRVTIKTIEGIRKYLKDNGLKSIKDITNTLVR